MKQLVDYYDIFIYSLICSIFMYAQWFDIDNLFTISWEVWLEVSVASLTLTMIKVGLDWLWTKF